MRIPFKRKNAMLLLSLAMAYPSLHAAAPAGVAQFTTGDASLRRGADSGALARGRALESGDTITTGPDGQAQVRFTDGSIVSLRAKLSNLESQMAEARTTLGPKHPKAVELQSQIEATRRSLAGEVQSISEIEGRTLGSVGERTRQAADLLRQDIQAALGA